MNDIRKEALKMAQTLPEGSTWDDVMYQVYVKKKLELAIMDEKAGRLIPHEDVKNRFRRT